MNKTKTEGIWQGQLKHCRDKCEDINWCTTPIKSLGIYFGHNKQECQKLNFEKQLLKCKKIITDWSKRNLTIIGKIVIIKSLVLPNLTYIASNTIIPKDMLH